MYSNSRLIQVYANNVVFALKIRFSLYKIVITYLLSPLFNAIFHFYKIILCLCFPYVIMYTLYISKAIENMSIDEIQGFIFEIYYKENEFSKENNCYSKKHIRKTICCCSQKN